MNTFSHQRSRFHRWRARRGHDDPRGLRLLGQVRSRRTWLKFTHVVENVFQVEIYPLGKKRFSG